MKINIERIKWLVIGLLCFGLLLSINTCNKKNKQIVGLNFERQKSDSIANKYGQTILTQEVLVTNNSQTIKNLTDSIFNLNKAQDRRIKDVLAYYKGISNIQIKNKLVPYLDTNSIKKWEDSVQARCSKVIEYYEANSISVLKTAKDSTKDYSVLLTATITGIRIDSLSIPDSQYIRFVTIKGGLLKKDASGKRHLFTRQSIQVQVLHTNPLIQVTGQNSAIYISPKKARWFEKALLIGGGIFLGSKL